MLKLDDLAARIAAAVTALSTGQAAIDKVNADLAAANTALVQAQADAAADQAKIDALAAQLPAVPTP